MSTTLIIPASDNLVQTVLRFLEPAGDDYSSTAVVFPGKRPAHFLRKALAELHGTACIPPRVFSFESLTDYLYATVRSLPDEHPEPGAGPAPGPDIAPLDAVGLLYELHQAMDDRIGGGKFDRLEAFLPLGLRLFDALEELRKHEVSARELRAALPLSQFPNADRLALFYEAFYDRLAAGGGLTRSLRLSAVAAGLPEIDLSGFRRIVLAGFYAFSPLERSIVRFLRSCPQAVFIYQEGPGLALRLQEVGDPAPVPAPAMHRPALSFYKAGGTHAEVYALNDVLHRILERGEQLDERTVVVLPAADALFPVVQWTLPLVPEQNFNVSLGYPAGRTPTFGFLAGLLQAFASMDRGRVYAPDYIAFMLHPYTKNIVHEGKPEITRVLVHTIEETLAGRVGTSFLRLELLENDTALLAAAVRRTAEIAPGLKKERLATHLQLLHDIFFRRPLASPTLGAFAGLLIEALTFVDEFSTARHHEMFRPFMVSLLEQLDQLASSRLAAYRSDDPSSYGSIALRWLMDASVPFPGTPVRGLQVLGLLETRNLRFDRVCLLDVNEDVLPGSPAVDPLLPPSVRLALHLPLQEERETHIDYYTSVLLQGAREAHLFYQEGGKKERSRLIERLVWEEERRQGRLLGDDAVTPVMFDVTLANRRPDPIGKTPDIIAALGRQVLTASALDTYLHCPLKFYYAYLLGLSEKRQVEADIDAPGIGTVVHDVLLVLDSPLCGKPLDASRNREADLERAVDLVFKSHFGAEASAAQLLLRGQVEYQLQRYLTWYGEHVLRASPVTIVGLEVPLAGEFNGRPLKGRADRIEQRGRRKVIIDFKTGGDEKRYRINIRRLDPDDDATWGPCLRSFQLPLYMVMAGAASPGSFGEVEPVYVMLGDARKSMSPEVPLFDPDLPAAGQWEKITRTLSAVLDRLYDAGSPFAAPEDLSSCCPSCPFNGVCGTGWVKGIR